MRASAACLLLLLRCGSAVRLGKQQEEGGPLVCRATCQLRGTGNESRSCPFAKYLEDKYYYWRHYRGCDAPYQRVDLSCGGLKPGGYGAEIRKQLGGKHVVMIGDSTMRQTYIGLLCLMWEEGLVGQDTSQVHESREDRMSKEDKGFIEAKFPEIGQDTKFTYIRKDWGHPGPMMMSILDTADVTVANMAMHYSLAVGANLHRTVDNNASYTIYYGEDVADLISNMTTRGRPGHRVFWREALLCPMYDYKAKPDTSYGCVDDPNPSLKRHNDVVAKLDKKGVDVLPVGEMFLRYWWAHPGGHDCCHMVGRVPGLLASVSRIFVSMLAHPKAKGIEIERRESACPRMESRCAELRPQTEVF